MPLAPVSLAVAIPAGCRQDGYDGGELRGRRLAADDGQVREVSGFGHVQNV